MIIIGIDPGTAVTGYGIIEQTADRCVLIDYGCIRPPRERKLSERRQIIFEGLAHLLDIHQPTAMSVETQFMQHNIQSAMKLGMIRGIAILAASLRSIPVFEYAPTRAKKAVAGRGQASKQQIQGMIKLLLNLQEIPEPEDAADALALAICHLHSMQSLAPGTEV
jgi:crossover junction endodeoxyribonuclease RuvC